MPEAKGIREIAYVDCKGGGQIEVVNGTAYVGHTAGPEATTIMPPVPNGKEQLLRGLSVIQNLQKTQPCIVIFT